MTLCTLSTFVHIYTSPVAVGLGLVLVRHPHAAFCVYLINNLGGYHPGGIRNRWLPLPFGGAAHQKCKIITSLSEFSSSFPAAALSDTQRST